jgi:hypothetical protein
VAHAYVDPVRAVATFRVVQQDEIDMGAALALGLEAGGDLVGDRKLVHITHGQPFRDGSGRSPPELLQGRFDVGGELPPHP